MTTTTAAVALGARPARAGWFTQAAQITGRWLTNTRRQVWGAAFSLVQPVVWILLFGQVFSSLSKLPGFGDAGYVTFLVPGVLMPVGIVTAMIGVPIFLLLIFRQGAARS